MINQETRVGLFVLMGIIIFALSVILIEDITLEKGYKIKVVFDNAEGLPVKGQVKVAGVEVGKVKDIELVKGKALVTVGMKPDVKIHKDAKAKIISVGMVGNKLLELTSGSPDEPLLQDGDVIYGESSMDLNSIIDSASEGLDDLVGQLKILEKGGKLEVNLNKIMSNLEEITRKLDSSLGKNGEHIKVAVKNINKASKDIAEVSKKFKDLKINDSVLSKLMDDKELGEKVENIINSLEKVGKNLEKRFK